MNHEYRDNDLERILSLVKETKPISIEQLIEDIEVPLNIPRSDIIKHIMKLESKGKINLVNFRESEKMHYPIWFRINLFIILLYVLSVLLQTRINLFSYVVNFIGIIYLLILPGFNFLKILFPNNEITMIERITLAIIMSLILEVLIGIFLNSTPFGITFYSINISIFIIIIFFLIMGLRAQANSIIHENI